LLDAGFRSNVDPELLTALALQFGEAVKKANLDSRLAELDKLDLNKMPQRFVRSLFLAAVGGDADTVRGIYQYAVALKTSRLFVRDFNGLHDWAIVRLVCPETDPQPVSETAVQEPADKSTRPRAGDAKTEPVCIISLGDGAYAVGNTQQVVTEAEDNVLQAFLGCKGVPASFRLLEGELNRRTGSGDAQKTLRSLATAYDGFFAAALDAPGKGKRGWGVSIKRQDDMK
jgi:hypothetical protein